MLPFATQPRRCVDCIADLPQSNDRARYIGGYLGFAIGFVVMTMCRSLLNLYSAWGASRQVHRCSRYMT